MRIVATYSHLNGEEYLLARNRKLYSEIKDIIRSVDASKFQTKISEEKTMAGRRLFDPGALNREFKRLFNENGWSESVYNYCITLDRGTMEAIARLPFVEQKAWLTKDGTTKPMVSKKQTDFVKNKVAVEVQFGKYTFVAFDLFVKHLLFYSGAVINLGVEILPMKSMLREPGKGRKMSTGIAYYEGEVYNVMRHGRGSPAVPLLIIGVADEPKDYVWPKLSSPSGSVEEDSD
jgi:hypothetical protein